MSQTFLLDINNTQITLHYGTILTDAILDNTVSNDDHLLAEVNRNPDDPSILGLKNLSQQEWQITFADGKTKTTSPGRSIKIEENMVIHFGDSAGTIRKINTEQIDTLLFNASHPEPEPEPDPPVQTASSSNRPDLPPRNPPKFPWVLLGWLSVIIIGGFFIYQANQPPSSPTTTVEQETDICAEVERKKEIYRGRINWAAVDEAFWQQTDYPYGQPLDSSYPDYQYYRQRWCEIANQYLGG